MTGLFSILLKLGLAGSYAIVFVMIVRFFLRKSPKIFSYILWSIVFFRLICPVSFNTNFSLVPESITYPKQTVEIQIIPSDSDELSESNENLDESLVYETLSPSNQTQSSNISILSVLSGLWSCGVLLLWGYSFLSFSSLKRKLSSAQWIKDNVYESDKITTPFVLGIVHPKIFLPKGSKNEELPYILMHENIHIQRKDHLIKPLAFMIVCLHWFNPLVWMAWFSMSQDMEMSCDEAVIRKMGTSIKKEYSQSLLNMSSQKSLLNTSPLAFSDHNAKNRIINVLNYKKPAFWMIMIGTILLFSLSLALSTNRYKSPELKEALDRASTYLHTDPNDIQVLSKTSRNELTIYQLSSGNNSSDETFFFIFRNGELQDTYFNLPSISPNQFLNSDASEQIAKQFVKDIYQKDVTFNKHLHTGKLVSYGTSTTEIGTILHFKAETDDTVICVSVSSATGKVIASSNHKLWDKNWKVSSSDQHHLMIADDYVILTKNRQAFNIFPAKITEKQIQFEDQMIPNNQSSFKLKLDKNELQFCEFTPLSSTSFFESHMETRVHAELNTLYDFNHYWNNSIIKYFQDFDKETLINTQNSMISSYASFLNKEKKINWIQQWERQMEIIDELISTQSHKGIQSEIDIEDGLTVFKLYYPIQDQNQLVWTTYSTLVSENGQYKINETITVHSEQFWKTIPSSSPEKIIECFLQAFEHKDLSSIYQMMPYQTTALEDTRNFILLEIDHPELVSLSTNQINAKAQIHFKTIQHFTDQMGTTSSYTEGHTIELIMKKTESGWILTQVTQ